LRAEEASAFSLTELFSLRGRVALITGSGRGLGYAMARGMAQAGAAIILNGRNEQQLQQSVAALAAEGHAVRGSVFDVTDSAKIKAAVADVGQVDILVNNAGIQHRQPLEAFDEAAWRQVLDVNLTGVFLTTQAVVTGMIARKSGKIINISSLIGEVSRRSIGAYAASKGGLKMLTKTMANEWAVHNIQANAIAPGYFKTEMNIALTNNIEFDNWVRERTPAGRWGEPSELIGAAVFLASNASNYVNGQTIVVDGGLLAAI
jgi:gluconate 5-dehydrogenase